MPDQRARAVHGATAAEPCRRGDVCGGVSLRGCAALAGAPGPRGGGDARSVTGCWSPWHQDGPTRRAGAERGFYADRAARRAHSVEALEAAQGAVHGARGLGDSPHAADQLHPRVASHPSDPRTDGSGRDLPPSCPRSAPGCPPGLRPVAGFLSRVTVGGSLDGGLLELRDDEPSCSSSSCTRAVSFSTCATSFETIVSSSAIRSSRQSRGTSPVCRIRAPMESAIRRRHP
jgi:hypothetical protein